MHRPGNRISRLSDKKVCEIVGISPQQRQAFVSRGLLPTSPGTGSTLHDTLRLAALVSLTDRLTPTEVKVAWPQLDSTLEGSVPGGRLDVVFDVAFGSINIAWDSDELRRLVTASHTVRVIPLAERLGEVADAFRRWVEASGEGPKRRPRKVPRRKRAT